MLAVTTAFTAPLYLARRIDRQHREDRDADWARQDMVAAQAAEAAELLLQNQRAVANSTAETNSQLHVIHTLVNSNMTAAMQAEVDATNREEVMMREVMALNTAAGREITPVALAALSKTQAKIAELEAALADRLKQTNIAEAQE